MTRSTLAALAVALPLCAAAQVAPAALQQGLVASYPLDGDAMDQVTHVRATPVATRPADDRNGARGGALWFDGVRAAVNLGSGLQPARFTISAWIRPEAIDRVQVVVSKIRNLPGHWQKNLELRLEPGGRLLLHVPSGVAWDAVPGTRAVPQGRWTHVAAVYDGARAQLYVDGTPDGAPLPVRYEQSPSETWIGARPESGGRDGRTVSGPTFFFLGAIDDVRIWDRPLAPGEIALAAGRARPAPPDAEPPPPYPPLPGPAPGARVSPLAVYPLDGDGREASGGPAGTVVGARAAEDRLGNPRGALALSGKDHVDLGLRTEPEQVSLAVWIRPARAEREQVIFSKHSSAPGARERWLELRLDNAGRLVLAVPNASPYASSVTSTRRLASNRWVHVAATYDGDRAALYVDGAPAGEARLDPFDASRGPAFVGARPDAKGKRARFAPLFEGRLDDLRVYRGALSADEVVIVAREGERLPPGRGDDDAVDSLLVTVGKLLVRYETAIVRRDPEGIGRAEERIVRELDEAARDARGDRELAERLRQAQREVERGRGSTDATSLDRKRSALVSLSEALWNDLARELDDAPAPAPGPRRGEPRREGW